MENYRWRRFEDVHIDWSERFRSFPSQKWDEDEDLSWDRRGRNRVWLEWCQASFSAPDDQSESVGGEWRTLSGPEEGDAVNWDQSGKIGSPPLRMEQWPRETNVSKVFSIDIEVQNILWYRDKSLDQLGSREHKIHHSGKDERGIDRVWSRIADRSDRRGKNRRVKNKGETADSEV